MAFVLTPFGAPDDASFLLKRKRGSSLSSNILWTIKVHPWL